MAHLKTSNRVSHVYHIPGGSLFFFAVIEYYFDERCSNPGYQVPRATKFASAAPNICGIGFVSPFWHLECWKVRASVAVAQLVEALRYKPEGRGFDSRWCHWNFART